ncbi:MAG: hypothetical protein HFJ48_00575 [Clostridia bacterium]|nr:hypothetical protein [Clostridia bacterium]
MRNSFLYSLYEKNVNGFEVHVDIVPDFNGSFGLFCDTLKISTSLGEYYLENKYELDDVLISEDAKWAIISDNAISMIYLFVTESTKTINSNYGDEWNKIFNELMVKAQRQYCKSKNSEVRLYFWDQVERQLKICFNHCELGYSPRNSKFIYYLQDFPDNQVLCNTYASPRYSCFILGKISKTIRIKGCRLLNYIEPISEIYPNVRKNFDNFQSLYYPDLGDFETILLNLLVLCINHTDEGKSPILPDKAQSSSHKELAISHQEYDVTDFNQYLNEVKKALSTGNTNKILALSDAMHCFDV